MEISERGARDQSLRRNARCAAREVEGNPRNKPRATNDALSRHRRAGGSACGALGSRSADSYQRAEAEDPRRAAFVTRLAISAGWNAVPHTVANDDTAGDAALGRKEGFGLVFVPRVRRTSSLRRCAR